MAGFVAAAIVGSTIIGGGISSSNAASTQANAAERVAENSLQLALFVLPKSR
jgi:hypothetical protein